MTGERRDGRARPFGPHELDGVPGVQPEELAAELRLARDLEHIASTGGVAPSADFTDRVMGAIAAEPSPAPVVAARSALRRGAPAGFLASVRDAFRVSFGGGFPMAARAQALALVLLVTGVVAGSGLATAGALGVFDDRGSPSPEPSIVAPSVSPSPEPSVSPTPTDTPDATLTPPSPSPSVTPDLETPSPGETEEPGETDEATDDHGGSGSGDDSDGRASGDGTPDPEDTPKPRDTPDPDDTPKPDDTPDPDDTPEPDDD